MTMFRCHDMHDGYFCIALDAAGRVPMPVSSPMADWKTGPGGYVRNNNAFPLDFRVCANVALGFPGRRIVFVCQFPRRRR